MARLDQQPRGRGGSVAPKASSAQFKNRALRTKSLLPAPRETQRDWRESEGVKMHKGQSNAPPRSSARWRSDQNT